MRTKSMFNIVIIGAICMVGILGDIHAETTRQQKQSSLPKPIAYWNFDGIRDATVPDLAGNYPGQLMGENSLPQIVDGISGKALSFEPGEVHYVRVDGMKELCPRDQMTIMAWVWVDARTKMIGDIVGYLGEQRKGEKKDPMQGFRLKKSWACASIQFFIGDGSEQILQCSAPGLRTATEHWMHVAGTYDGKIMKIYINGVEKGSFKITTKIAPNPRPLIIGNYVGRQRAYPFHGMIDEVRLYDIALTESQILKAAEEGMEVSD